MIANIIGAVIAAAVCAALFPLEKKEKEEKANE